jgi:enamine deaminase RidA (YjgF/YER057c/UK114 family)
MTHPIPIFPEGRQELYIKNRYSAAIRSGDLLFISGQVGSREDGSPEPDLAAQIRLAFDNLRMVLAAAGCTFRDVVDITTFHVEPENHVKLMMSVKDEVFVGPDYPNWTAIGVTWLSGFQFEIKAIARVPAEG